MGRKEEFGGSVAFMISVERPVIEVATRIVISVRNHVVHA